MIKVVLDASAVLALLKGERGASKVAGIVADAAVGVFNQAEVVSHFVHLGAPVEDIQAMLAAMPYAVIAADEDLAWEAGALRAVTRCAGLSLGDRFCLALAKRLSVPAHTADTAWKEIAVAAEVKVVTIR